MGFNLLWEQDGLHGDDDHDDGEKDEGDDTLHLISITMLPMTTMFLIVLQSLLIKLILIFIDLKKVLKRTKQV